MLLTKKSPLRRFLVCRDNEISLYVNLFSLCTKRTIHRKDRTNGYYYNFIIDVKISTDLLLHASSDTVEYT